MLHNAKLEDRNLLMLTVDEVTILDKIASENNTYVGDCVKNFLEAFYGYQYHRETETEQRELPGFNIKNTTSSLAKVVAKVYPNPASDILHLEIQNVKFVNAKVEIVDVQGKVVLDEVFFTPSHAIRLRQNLSGNYTYRLFLDGKTAQSGSISIN